MRGPRSGERNAVLSRRELLGAAAVLALGTAVRAPARAEASIVRAGIAAGTSSAERLVRAMHRAAATAHAPSIVAAAISDGSVVWADAIGIPDLERGRPARVRTIYNIASVSKLVTTVAVLQGWEDGIVELDAPVNGVLPFQVHHPARRRAPITLRQLLTHTSGIRDAWSTLSGLYVDGDASIGLGRFLRGYLVPGGRWFDRGSNFTEDPPGARYLYGNVGFALAGFVLEAASGTAFDAWCRARIFEPLGMRDTSWHLAGLELERIARPYRYLFRNGSWRSHGLYGYPDYPDGLLRTTAPELARFLAAVANGGGLHRARILRASTVREMLTDQLTGLSAPWQGLGFYRVRPDGGEPLLGHNGGDKGVFADAWFRPADGAGAVVLANVSAWRASQYRALVDLRNRVVDVAGRWAA